MEAVSALDFVAVAVLVGLLCDLIADIAHCSSNSYTDKAALLTTQLRLIAVAGFFALLSVHDQAVGIIGQHGLLPLKESLMHISTLVDSKQEEEKNEGEEGKERSSFMKQMKISIGSRSLNVFMLKLVLLFMKPCAVSDDALLRQVRFALAVSLVAILVPHPVCFVYLYLFYFAIKKSFGKFMNLQWDLLLLECLLLSAFASLVTLIARGSCGGSWPRRMAVALCLSCFKFLLFRLMFGSGVVKILSGDKSWADLSAMSYHFLSQPLPNSLSPLLHRLPTRALQAVTLMSLLAETIVPIAGLFGGLLSQYTIILAVFATYVALQASIMGSGFFGFFNVLSIALCASLFARYESSDTAPGGEAAGLSLCLGPGDLALLLLCSVAAMHVSAIYLHALYSLLTRYSLDDSSPLCSTIALCTNTPLAQAVLSYVNDQVLSASKVLMFGNHYGLFANMTRGRCEIVIETSTDNERWETVNFKYKPSDEHSRLLPPLAMTPPLHMPRLDWELWFMALSAHRTFVSSGGRTCAVPLPPWMTRLLLGVAEGNESVLGLLGSGCPGRGEFVRVVLYSFEFSFVETVKGTGRKCNWKRFRLGEVLPSTPVSRLRAAFATPSEQQPHVYVMGERPKVETREEILTRTLKKLATGGRK